MAVLIAHDLYRFYHTEEEETLALRGVSLEVEAGELLAVMGPSGSGKSTLLACLAGLDEPDGGYVQIGEHRLTRRSETDRAALRAQYIGMMLQAGNLFGHITVEDNILVPMQLAYRVDPGRIDSLLESVGLQTRRRMLPSQLSGGEAARIALAIALSANPTILLADEPTGEVDAETEQQVMQLITQHCHSGGVAVLVTHSDAVAHYADRTIHLADGKVV
ncbi:MAG: ABC transporter ATP-binding protein [Armatimonadota bacterium]